MPEPLVMTSDFRANITARELILPGEPTIQIKQGRDVICLDQAQTCHLIGWMMAALYQWDQNPDAQWLQNAQKGDVNQWGQMFKRSSNQSPKNSRTSTFKPRR